MHNIELQYRVKVGAGLFWQFVSKGGKYMLACPDPAEGCT